MIEGITIARYVYYILTSINFNYKLIPILFDYFNIVCKLIGNQIIARFRIVIHVFIRTPIIRLLIYYHLFRVHIKTNFFLTFS